MEAERNVGPASQRTSLSVLVPVYNERYVVAESLQRLTILSGDEHVSRVEVIVVDDGSTDGSAEVLEDFARRQPCPDPASGGARISWTFIRHDRNRGKGRAIRTALERATGDITIIHDADLEYHPADISRIVRVFVENSADAVFGSRFAGSEVRRALMYRHELGNKALTLACNLVSNLNLTDVWTCYKAVRTGLLRSIPLASNDFRIEPELAIKLAKREARIFEVPISYFGRTYREGKKINWKDGVLALWAILRFGLSDNLYCADEYGSQVLARLARAPRFNAWMADAVRPFCGERVLEIGSGVGNLSRRLTPRVKYVASDVNPLYLQTLSNLASNRPYMSSAYCDVTDLNSFPATEEGYDTVICLNVIEHVADDRAALANIKSVLSADGRALILVPNGPWNYGTLDRVLGHKRRYTKETLTRLAEGCGFRIEQIIEFDRVGTLAWYLNGKIMRRSMFGLGQIWMLNQLTPLIRLLDPLISVPPLSLIAVMVPDRAEPAVARHAMLGT